MPKENLGTNLQIAPEKKKKSFLFLLVEGFPNQRDRQKQKTFLSKDVFVPTQKEENGK